MTRHDYLDKLDANLSGRASDIQTHYQQMSTGYSPLRLATPSGTGEAVQPCVNCTSPVAWVKVGITGSPGAEHLWLHVPANDRLCAELEAGR